MLLKLRFLEKATKLEISHICFDVTDEVNFETNGRFFSKRGTGFSDMDAGHLTLLGGFQIFPFSPPHEIMKIKVV